MKMLHSLERVDEVDALHRLASHLERRLFPGGTEGPPPMSDPLLIAVESGPGGLRVGCPPLPGDPLDDLVGLHAPGPWWCVGVATTGLARGLPETAVLKPRGGDRPGHPVQIVHLVSRAGDAVSVHRLRGGAGGEHEAAPSASFRRGPMTAWGGLLDDHLRRVLDLPCAAPPASTVELWATCWLDALLSAALRGDLAGATWAEMVAFHPAAGCSGTGPAPGTGGQDPNSRTRSCGPPQYWPGVGRGRRCTGRRGGAPRPRSP